ncbi:MAG: uracil-DNA glycosylase family protein [Pseudomonadota bacterium]|jgi:DNA polymerase|nr:uracil-DNA glycosylase [Alphaproteobacteria bacterium]
MRNTLKALGCDYIYQDTPIDVTSSLQIQREKHIAAIIKTEHPAYACKTLEELKNAMLSFNECALKKTALNTVFCDGNPQADVMLIGEAPGADEDAQGLPFVGQSGQLLNKIFQAIGLDRTKLYIANILPWRPPGNRTPTNEEIAMCQPFVEQHIQLIRPKLLIFLGGVSAKTLLKTTEGITKLRGRFHEYKTHQGETISSFATYHPAYLMRSPGQKAQVWHDMIKIKQYLGLS